MKCIDCSYWFSDDPNEAPFCHYSYNDGHAPCEEEDRERETEDVDEEIDRAKNIYTVFISDSAVYDKIEAESEEEAKMLALGWFSERMPDVIVKSVSDTVYLVYEENHGLIGTADSWDSAIDFLITSGWINGCCELWLPDEQRGIDLEDCFNDWRKWLRETATADDIQNLGFRIDCQAIHRKEG